MSDNHDTDGTSGSEQSTSVNRRRFVKAIGAAGGAALASSTFVSTAGANTSDQPDDIVLPQETETGRRLLAKHTSPDEVQKVVNSTGQDLLRYLHENDYIRGRSVSINSVEKTTTNPEENDALATVEHRGDKFTDRLEVPVRSQKRGDLKIFVEPEMEKSFAIHKPESKQSNEVVVIDPARLDAVNTSPTTTEDSTEVGVESACLQDRMCRTRTGAGYRQQELVCCGFGDPQGTCYFGQWYRSTCDCVDMNICCWSCNQCDIDALPCIPDV